jgi:hypothetical protein
VLGKVAVKEYRRLLVQLMRREYLAHMWRQPLNSLKGSFSVVQCIFIVAIKTSFNGMLSHDKTAVAFAEH